jgi:DNA-binding CsgD family transcriptional regulator
MAQLAYEEAARLYARAVEVAPGVLSPAERVRLLIATAEAHARCHEVATTIRTCAHAAELARQIGDAEGLGRAALVLQGVSELAWLQPVRGWCEQALRGLAGSDSALRAQLLAQLAHTMLLDVGREPMAATSAAALAMAERLGDRAALVGALRALQLARCGADGNAERLALGDRMLAVADGDPDVRSWGHLWRFDALLQAGRVAAAEAELQPLGTVVAGMRQPLARLHLMRSRAAVLFARGRFAEAETLNAEVTAIAERGRHRGPAMTAVSFGYLLATHTGTDGLDDGWIGEIAEAELPFTAMLYATLGCWHLALGRRAEAARRFADLPPPGSPRVPPFMAVVVEAMRSVLATDLGDAAAAEGAYRVLFPHADLHASGGAGAVATHGSVHLFLGIAATGAGRLDAAVRHLRTAVAVNDTAGLLPATALARCRLAEALRAHGRPADADEVVAAAVEADAAAERLGMAPLRARLAELTDAMRDGGVLSRRETEIAGLVARGLTNRQIVATAHISERTVETHVQHILAKLGFTGRSQIAAWATRRTT